MRIKLSAVIPTVQYGNIQPEFEVEVPNGQDDEAVAAATATLESKIQNLWDKYGEKPLTARGSAKRVKAFVGGEIDYDEINHIYSWNGEKYLSGSQHAKTFEKPFDGDRIAKAMGDKFKVEAKDIQAMWKLKSDVSVGFGTAIHAALELYGKYDGLATQLEKTSNLHDHPIIKKAVEEFFIGREKEKAEYEPIIISHEKKHAGQVDRLLITGDKRCRIQDYKTNAVLPEEKLRVYWEQLKFYGNIMKDNDWVVEGLDIFHWDGVWHKLSKEIK